MPMSGLEIDIELRNAAGTQLSVRNFVNAASRTMHS